jgi:hypothetical protein
LERVLTEDEIQLVRAIYSRTRLQLGREAFKPNIGVGQGSIISPSLFNIYCEEMYELLEREVGISKEDMMGYADDVLILCSSIDQLRKVIAVVEEWSLKNNLRLNPKKSGVLEFLPRMGKKLGYLSIGSTISGIPVVGSYKYLGLLVDGKLTIDGHLEHIAKKAEFQALKLWPLLKNTSLDFRINLWTVLIRPLFEMLICLYETERKTNREKIENLIRKTFRKFTLLKNNIKKSTIHSLMRFDFERRVREVSQLARIKWEARKEHKVPIYPRREPEEREGKRYYPAELQVILNMKSALCPFCKVPCNSSHMINEHQIYIPCDEDLLENIAIICESTEETRKEKMNRIREIINPYIRALSNHLNSFGR